MSVDDARTSASSPAIPHPRTGEDRPVTATSPWPEPWQSAGESPRTEYWDVFTARWRSAGPLPRPRREG